MPLYEYRCDACGHRFEKIQKFSDPLEDRCPKCGGVVHKLASSPAFQFKGSGFYVTDYAKKDYLSATKADSEKSEKSEKSDKSEKSEKSERSEKSEKSQKSDTSSKSEKSSSSGDSSSSGSSSTPSSSTPSAPSSTPAKDS